MAPGRGVGTGFGVTWAKITQNRKTNPNPVFLAGIVVETSFITMIRVTESIIVVCCRVITSLCY